MIGETTVFLSPEQARLFVEFQRRAELFALMDAAGALDVRSGSVTVHFDPFGAPKDVEVRRHFRVGGYPQVDTPRDVADNFGNRSR